jgi:ribonuclease HI
VGTRVDGAEYHVCSVQCDQIPSTSGLCGRVDRDSNSACKDRAQDLDHLLRWLGHEGACVGLVFISPLGVRMEYMVRLHFPASNNTAEYEALINDLRITVELGIKHLEIKGDSDLVVGQVMKDKNCVDPKMAAYCRTRSGEQVSWPRATPCAARPQQGGRRARESCI